MNKTIPGAVVVLVVLVAGYYLFTLNGSSAVPALSPAVESPGTQSTAGTTATPAATTSPAVTSSVSIQNFTFTPSTLAAKAGTTVTWKNNDAVPHTVTSDSGLFDSKVVAPGESFSFAFTSTGSVSYHCALHPMMKGSVTVQ